MCLLQKNHHPTQLIFKETRSFHLRNVSLKQSHKQKKKKEKKEKRNKDSLKIKQNFTKWIQQQIRHYKKKEIKKIEDSNTNYATRKRPAEIL